MKLGFVERIMLPERVRIPVLGGIWYRFLSEQKRKQIKKIDIASLSLNQEPRNMKIVCTLTSFPGRIDTVQYTIKTLFTQTYKPDRIVLWLAEEEFPDRKMPESIFKLQERGLEVRYCENLYGHKRYYKLIEEQKEDECIIMFDDDILFPPHLIERTYKVWKKHPKCIVCDRGQVLSFQNDKVMNPGRWSSVSKVGLKNPSFRILASPGGGCLIPPGSFYKDVNNSELIKKYALKTGDIWLMFMAAENDTKTLRTYRYHRIFILSEKNQTVQLGREAIYQGRYEKTFAELSKAYPHAYGNMLSEVENGRKYK